LEPANFFGIFFAKIIKKVGFGHNKVLFFVVKERKTLILQPLSAVAFITYYYIRQQYKDNNIKTTI